MPRKCTGHNKHPLPTTQEITLYIAITRWSIQKEIRQIIFFAVKIREVLYGQQKNPLGSDHELLIAKVRLKWKKVEKTTSPFIYDLNQIPYDYTVKVTNTFKGLDVTERVPEELWTEVHNTVQEEVIKTIPKKKKCKTAK